METKNGYPANLNMVDKIELSYQKKQGCPHINWTTIENKKFSRLGGPSLWPKTKGVKYPFKEDSNDLNGKRLLFIIKGEVREIPFVATVKSHWGTIIDIIHTNGREETVDLKNPKFDDVLSVRCLDA